VVVKVVALANQKGGVGKTTTTVNLAAAVAMKGKRCLLADLDPQGHSSINLLGPEVYEEDYTKTMYEVLSGKIAPQAAIRPFPSVEGLDILPTNLNLGAAEIEFLSAVGRESIFSNMLEEVSGYDYVFVDCPPNLGVMMMNGLVAADSVIVPVQVHFFPLFGLKVLWRFVERLKKLNKRLEITGVVATFTHEREKLSKRTIGQLRDAFGDLVYETTIRRNTDVAEAPSNQEAIVAANAKAPGGQDYLALAEEFLRREEGSETRRLRAVGSE